METWHDRLQLALDIRHKTWPDLVAVTGLKKPSVYAWKPNATKRATMMDGSNAAVVCDYLGIRSTWLFFGKGPSGLDVEEQDQAPDIQAINKDGQVVAYWVKLKPDRQRKLLTALDALANLNGDEDPPPKLVPGRQKRPVTQGG